MWYGALASALSALAFFAGFLFGSLALLFAAFFFMYAAFPLCLSIATQEIVPHWRKSISFGVIAFVGYLFGLLGPTLVGRLSDSYSLKGSLAWSQASMLLGCFCFLAAATSYKRDLARARDEESARGEALAGPGL